MDPKPSRWKCYDCGYIGREGEFQAPDTNFCSNPMGVRHLSNEDVFPYRLYTCEDCGRISDQDAVFDRDQFAADFDPLNDGLEPRCGRYNFRGCGSNNLKQIDPNEFPDDVLHPDARSGSNREEDWYSDDEA